jgi:hypothetical protein
MSVILKGAGSWGRVVERATAALPQTAASALFTVSTGRVIVTSIIGEVTTVIQTFDPTAAGATQDLCAVLDITADAVGTMYSITGTPATAMQDALNFLPSSKVLAEPIVLKPGSVLLDCAASNSGSVKWTLSYWPLDTGASVAAA